MKFRFGHSSGFTLVEIIIGMTIFSVGLSAVYALLLSVMGTATYSRHEIVVANLLREEIELVKNIRDTNIRNFIPWDSALVQSDTSLENSFSSGVFLIENNFSDSGVTLDKATGKIQRSPVSMKKVSLNFSDTGALWESTRLYLDANGRYTHALTDTGSLYASYIRMIPLSFEEGGTRRDILDKSGKPAGYIIDARVIVKNGSNFREYDARSALTNWIQ